MSFNQTSKAAVALLAGATLLACTTSSKHPPSLVARGAALDAHMHLISQPLLDGVTGGRVPTGEGTTYADVLDETRASVAQVYLKQRDISLTVVGHLLGFAEQSSFSRAFKRWTGSTPSQSRAQGGGATAEGRV